MPSREQCRRLLKAQRDLENAGWYFALDQAVAGTSDGKVKSFTEQYYGEAFGPNDEKTPKHSDWCFWNLLERVIESTNHAIAANKQANYVVTKAKHKKKAK